MNGAPSAKTQAPPWLDRSPRATRLHGKGSLLLTGWASSLLCRSMTSRSEKNSAVPTRVLVGAAILIATLSLSEPARAQGNPKFEFGKVEEVKQVEWKAQAKGGFLL